MAGLLGKKETILAVSISTSDWVESVSGIAVLVVLVVLPKPLGSVVWAMFILIDKKRKPIVRTNGFRKGQRTNGEWCIFKVLTGNTLSYKMVFFILSSFFNRLIFKQIEKKS